MGEESAAYAVLGIDIESLGAAVARHWGLDDSVLTLIRRLPPGVPVRSVDGDDDMLRAVASCANEAIDALAQPPHRVMPALQRVVQRYGRALDIGMRDLQAALMGKEPEHLGQTAHAPLDELPEPAARARGAAA